MHEGVRLVFLLDARDRFAAQVLQQWVDRFASGNAGQREFIRLRTRQTRERLNAHMQALASFEPTGAEPAPRIWLQPLRLAWFADQRRGHGLLQDLFHGHLTHPGPLRQRWLARYRPDRMRCISGQGAFTHDMAARYRDRADRLSGGQTVADFLQDQAILVLERAERLARGARYKISRLLPHEVFADSRFQETLLSESASTRQPLVKVHTRAVRYLREMAASQTPLTLDLLTAVYRAAIRSNHDPRIDVQDAQLARVASLIGSRPVVFLISHKSMLDTLALSLVLFDANLPVPLTFGGINLSTPGVGAFARRAGIIFLRRSFQDNEVYKATFRRYIDYLIEKRFSLLWALEGTRSRTGKLLAPRYGLFNYVVDSVLRTGLHDLAFIPVSVTYDQITEVGDYAIEQRGRSKSAEGMGWMLRFFRRGKSHGRIFVRFGDAISLPELGTDASLSRHLSAPDRTALVQSLATQVAMRMNRATPITATAILTLILLASGRRAQNLAEIQSLARSVAILVRRRKIEIVGLVRFRDEHDVRATLGQLHDTGIVSYFDEGIERLYNIQPEQHHQAAYYRNTAIHHFVIDAVAEVALLQAARFDPEHADDAFYASGDALRELFRFEFYFAPSDGFREELTYAANDRMSGWQTCIQQGPQATEARLAQVRPLVAHGVLRAFVDAYRVLATALVVVGAAPAKKKADFLADVLRLGKQAWQLAEVFSPESVSRTLYESAYQLAESRDLLAGDRLAARRALESELVLITDCLDRILALAQRR